VSLNKRWLRDQAVRLEQIEEQLLALVAEVQRAQARVERMRKRRVAQSSSKGSRRPPARRNEKTVWILAKPGAPGVPDFSKRTHDEKCFIVEKHEEGSWEFVHARKAWLRIPVRDVPRWVRSCSFCDDGR